MSSSTFNCQIVGRLGSDAKVNKIGENNAISFSVAISEKKGEENEQERIIGKDQGIRKGYVYLAKRNNTGIRGKNSKWF